jgi:hypothetical protein
VTGDEKDMGRFFIADNVFVLMTLQGRIAYAQNGQTRFVATVRAYCIHPKSSNVVRYKWAITTVAPTLCGDVKS